MRDYYTLMELLVALKKLNLKVIKELDVLNVFLKYFDEEDSLNYGLDYFINDEKNILIKHILKNNYNLNFFEKLSVLDRKNTACVIKENDTYNLEKNNIVIVNPLYKKHFSNGISCILNNSFLNSLFVNRKILHNDNEYNLKIIPTTMSFECINQNGKSNFNFSFDAKANVLNFDDMENKNQILEIINIKLPKEFFSKDIINLIDEIIINCKEEELSSKALVKIDNSNNSSSLTLTSKLQKIFIKRRRY